MTRKTCALVAPGLLLLSGLTACGDDPAPDAAGAASGSGAAGDVQGGVISDAMLPLESVTSQAPSRGGGGGDDDDSEDSGEASDEGSDAGTGPADTPDEG